MQLPAGLSPIDLSVFSTIAFFDLFDYPLTVAEIMRYRISGHGPRKATLREILSSLSRLPVSHTYGYYTLRGRTHCVPLRMRRYRMSAAKLRRARFAVRCMAILPSIRYIAVCNSLALSNADTESDIDLFVIVRAETIWITRLLIVGVLSLFRLRPTVRTHADKICMSFFVSENALNLSSVAIQGDIYLAEWLMSLVPLFDDGIGERFASENTWVSRIVSGYRIRSCATSSPSRCFALWKFVTLALFRRFNSFTKRMQYSRFPHEVRSRMDVGSSVVVSDDMLKFHVGDRREEYRDRHKDTVQQALHAWSSSQPVPETVNRT